jgi:copper chaperone CopZ
MNVVHIKTDGMHCDACPPLIEAHLGDLDGVKAARAVRAMSLTSVLFDPDLTDPDAIRDRITDSGFDARVLVIGALE